MFILGYITIALGTVTFFAADAELLRVRFAHVDGLKEGNKVTFCGMKVGSVQSLGIYGNGVMAELALTQPVRLHRDYRIIIKDDADKLLTNARFDVGIQETNAVGAPALKNNIYSANTGELGYNDVYLTPGRYVLTYGTNRVYNLDVFENRFTVVDWPGTVTIQRQEVTLTNPVVNRLTLKNVKAAAIRGVKNLKKTISKAYRVDVQRLIKPYTIIFPYNVKVLRSRGIDPAKMRIAYYNPKTKKWTVIGRNNTKLQRVSVSVSAPGTFRLVATK